jgi:hypothetical protein
MKRVVAYVPDLMDRSRLGAVGSVEFVGSPADLPAAAYGADLVVVDLARPGVLDVLPQITAATIGFGSHVDGALLQAARDAGCQEVLARSAFFSRRLRDLLA